MNLKSAILFSALTFAGAANANITISKAYGGGGNANTYYGSDFVELVNTSTSAVSLAGMTLYYLPQGSSGDVINATTSPTPAYAGALKDVTLAPGQYFLVQLASGTAASSQKKPLPTADQTFGDINPSGTNGRFLVYNGTAANGTSVSALDPTKVQDYVGYGTTSGRYEGTGAAPLLTSTTALVRKRLANGQIQDTNDNAADFGAATADATLTINNSASAYAPVPEPASMAALGLGVLGLLKRRRKA